MSTPPMNSGISLESAPKTYRREQDKARPPVETVAWAKERFASLSTAVLKETRRIDNGRLDIPVYISLCAPEATRLTNTQKQMGKGAGPNQAEASALMELAERYSFFSFMRRTDFPWMTAPQAARFAAESGGAIMDWRLAAQAVYHPDNDLERAKAVYDLLPQTWAWARNLTSGRDELIPLGWFFAINEYNGPAAGNRQAEAILQSLCEVVERHVSAVVTLEERRTPAIAPESIDDLVSRELIDKFRRAGVEVFIKDFTCGLGIPSVAALCYDPATFPATSEIVYAAGTATSPTMALIRALTEVAQLAGDFNTGSNYRVSALPKFASLGQAAYVMEAEGQVALGDLPDLSGDDFAAEVGACVAALAERGSTVFTLDVTRPDLGIPAVYTIIPGAHFALRTTGTDAVFHAAKLAAQLPNPVEALAVLEGMAEAAGETYYLNFFRALALNALEEPEQALALLDRALKLDPPETDEASIHTHRGAALKDLGRYQEAKQALTRAAGFAEPHHEVFNLLGFCHFALKEHEESIEAFSRAIEIEPNTGINYANIGSNLRELGRVEEACRMYEHALELDPTLDFARDNLKRLRGK